jgi:hypothetical protein
MFDVEKRGACDIWRNRGYCNWIFKETPMIAGYQRSVARPREFLCVAASVGFGLCPLWPYSPHRLTGSPYILLSSFLPVFFPVPSRPRNAHDFLLQLSLSSCVDLTVDHTPRE